MTDSTNATASGAYGADLLTGKVALVSGVGPGLGRAIAGGLADAGAAVVVSARKESSWRPTVQAIKDRGGKAQGINCDISNQQQINELVQFAAKEFGGIDILINNAFTEEDWREPFTGFDPQRWRAPIEINLFGTLALSQAVIPYLRERDGGSIVMITTLSIKNPVPLLAGYAVSKSALTTAAQVMAKELGRHQIRVNCVAPGHIKGNSLEEYFAWIAKRRGVTAESVEAEIANENPLGHLAFPEEIAPAVVFLASPLARVITGQTLNVNCGRTLG